MGAREFFWFQGDAVDRLRARLANVGPDARLEVKIEGEGDERRMLFRVVDPDADAEARGEETNGWTNESHLCPPACP